MGTAWNWGGDKSAMGGIQPGCSRVRGQFGGALTKADTDHSSPQGQSLGPQDQGVPAEVCSQDLSLPSQEQGEVLHPCHRGKVQQPVPMSVLLGWARCHDNGAVAITAPLGNIWLQAPEPTGQ